VIRDYRDLALETLADSEAELRDMVLQLQADVVAYRQIAQSAIHALYKITRDRDRQRAANHRLLDAYRNLRDQRVRQDHQEAA